MNHSFCPVFKQEELAQMEETKTEEEKDKTTGIVYISDNDNMFFAPEGISEEERKRFLWRRTVTP